MTWYIQEMQNFAGSYGPFGKWCLICRKYSHFHFNIFFIDFFFQIYLCRPILFTSVQTLLLHGAHCQTTKASKHTGTHNYICIQLHLHTLSSWGKFVFNHILLQIQLLARWHLEIMVNNTRHNKMHKKTWNYILCCTERELQSYRISNRLTHWNRVTHICIGVLAIIF